MMPHSDSPNVLAAHLQSENISQREFALKIGSHQSIVSRVVNGLLRPTLDMAFAIEKATDGAVPAKCWLLPEDAGAKDR